MTNWADNWTEVRAKFPVTSRSVYLNTAAAGPLAESTARAGAEYYEQMMNDGDVHWDAWLVRREEVRAQVAAFINAEPEEIGFTTNTSGGMNLIVDALEKHGEVISCDLEFPVTTIPWMHRQNSGSLCESCWRCCAAGRYSRGDEHAHRHHLDELRSVFQWISN